MSPDSFGYSIKMSLDNLSATVEIRESEVITKSKIIEALRDIADEIETDAVEEELEQ